MPKVREIINAALAHIGAAENVNGPTAAQVDEALKQINRMLQSWSSQRNGIYSITTESFTLSPGQADYTYGSGGDFDSVRPTQILDCWVRDNNVDFIVLETTHYNYARITDKDIQTYYPEVFLHKDEYPLAKLTFYPVPNEAYPIYFHVLKPLSQYTNSANDLNLPPEYEEAVEWNLAMRLAPRYLGETPQTVASMAAQSYRSLKRLHAPPIPQIRTEIKRQEYRAYNIYEDE
jgi:hypothetical protein